MGLFTKKAAPASAPSRYKVLGTGCARCEALGRNLEAVLEKLGRLDGVEHVTDVKKIMAYGVMSTPALVIDDKVIAAGRVLDVKELEKILAEVC